MVNLAEARLDIRRDVDLVLAQRDYNTRRVYARALTSMALWFRKRGHLTFRGTGRTELLAALVRAWDRFGPERSAELVKAYLVDILYVNASHMRSTAQVHLSATRWFMRLMHGFGHLATDVELGALPDPPAGWSAPADKWSANVLEDDERCDLLIHIAKNDADPRAYPFMCLVILERMRPRRIPTLNLGVEHDFTRRTRIAIETWLRVRPTNLSMALFTGGVAGSETRRVSERTVLRILQRCLDAASVPVNAADINRGARS